MIVQPYSYFGNIHELASIIKEGSVCFIINFPFSKMSFKNRMVIASAQGPLHLSIPIKGGREQKIPMNELKISYDIPWQEQHWKAIKSNYKRAPFFEYYEYELQNLYKTEPNYLIDFLQNCHYWLHQQLKNNWEITLKETLEDATTFNPYEQAPKNYQLLASGIKYHQVFEERIGFLPNLCILDLLFSVGGKQAVQLLKTS